VDSALEMAESHGRRVSYVEGFPADLDQREEEEFLRAVSAAAEADAAVIFAVVFALLFNQGAIRNIPIAVLDQDNTTLSRKAVQMIDDTPTAMVAYGIQGMDEGERLMREGRIMAIVQIPAFFEKNILSNSQTRLENYVSGTNITVNGLLSKDIQTAVTTFTAGIQLQVLMKQGLTQRQAMAQDFSFTRPAGGNPALLTLDETETLFHEFGHALHFLFHDVKYRGLAEVEGDFVELPSQLMENWAFDPEVLKQYAVHYRSNEVIPKYLVDKLRRSELFNQGFMATELIAASLSDMDIHSITEYEPFDPMAFERKALTEKRGLIPQIEPRYRYPYFSHIFDGGYSAGYYFYTWAEVLDKDAFEAFRESGDLFNKKIAGDFRRKILARGGSEDGMTMYRDFRGKDPDKRAMLRGRGLLNEPEPSGEDAAPAAETASAAREN